MSEKSRSLAYAVALLVMATTLAVLVATSPSDGDRVEAIGQRIKCPVCQGESIAASPADMARDMMDLVEERVAAGFDNEEIIDELLGSFSGAVLLDPPVGGATLALWLAPVAALVIGLVVIALWRRRDSDSPADTVGQNRPIPRLVVPAVIVLAALGATALVTNALVDRGSGAASGVADLGEQNLDDVSNETLEAVIAANSEHPAIAGMRLALAERYFELGDYPSAFPHFLEVAQSETATSDQVVSALVSLGWMVWDGNGEAEAAVELFDQALEIDQGSLTATYLKAEVVWCGLDQPAEAASLFEAALASPDLTTETRPRVEDAHRAASSGEDCV